MSRDVFVKFEHRGTDALAGLVVRARASVAENPPLLGAIVAVVVAIGGLCWKGPPWARRATEWLVLIVLVERALSALLALPYAMFRRGDAPARPTREAWQDWRTRKMSVDASTEGIVVTHGARSSTLKWSDCRALATGRHAHVVYFGERGYFVLPRRAFRTGAKDDDFQALARAHVAKAPRTGASNA